MTRERCRLYLITPPQIDLDSFAARLDDALQSGDVACLQLRLKDASDQDVLVAAARLMPVCHRHDVALVINDRPDLAVTAGADGAHVGADDMAYEEARRLLGDDAICGVSCYDSKDLAMTAGEAGADYVAFGAFFETTTKTPRTRATADLFRDWQAATTVPAVAIGGITLDNCRELVEAGADFIAVISAVWDHPSGPADAVAAFNEILDACAAGQD